MEDIDYCYPVWPLVYYLVWFPHKLFLYNNNNGRTLTHILSERRREGERKKDREKTERFCQISVEIKSAHIPLFFMIFGNGRFLL